MDTKSLIELAASFERAQLWQRAAAVYDQLLESDPGDVAVLARRAAMACQQGDIADATGVLSRGAARLPPAAAAQKPIVQALLALGAKDAAVEALRRTLDRAPDLELFRLLAQVMMEGPTYYQHLRWLHELLGPRTYLEIGVWQGETLAYARPPTLALGVDPDPQCRAGQFAADTRIFPVTSDAFFADRLWLAEAPGRRFDLAFIDGLHLFEQVLRDFINVERHAAPGGVIALHDTLPLLASAATRDLSGPFACGDSWKILPCLERHRPDLRITTLATGYSGLTIVSRLDPASRVLEDGFAAIVAEIGALSFDVLAARLPSLVEPGRNSREALAQATGNPAV